MMRVWLNPLRQFRKGTEGVAVAGSKLGQSRSFEQCAEAVVLQFKNPVRVVKSLAGHAKWHGLEWHVIRIADVS